MTTETGVGCLGGLAGTLSYMAPERLRGAAADARSDVFDAGVVLYEWRVAARRLRTRTQSG